MSKKVQIFPIWHRARLMLSRFVKQLRGSGSSLVVWLRALLIMLILSLNIFSPWPTSAACLTYADMWKDSATLELGSDVHRPLTSSLQKTLPTRTKLVNVARTLKNVLYCSGARLRQKPTTGSGRR